MIGTKSSSYLIDLLSSIVHCEKEYERHSHLFQEGDRADQLFIVRSGKVRIGKTTLDGREITYRICSDGDLIHEIVLFSPALIYNSSAEMIESGKCAIIRKQDLEERLLHSQNLSKELIKWFSIEHQKSQSKFRDLILHGKKGALYSTLIRLANSYGIPQEKGILIDIVLTNQELANFCGMSREVVNRLLNGLRKTGKITMENGKIFICDLNFLKKEILCENCPVEVCNIF